MKRHMETQHPEDDNEVEDGEEDDNESGEEDEDEGSDEEDGGENEDLEDDDEVAPLWQSIREEAWTPELENKFDEIWQALVEEGIAEEDAKDTAAQQIKPILQSNIRSHLTTRVVEMKELRRDPIYKVLEETRKRARDEEEFDAEEAWHHTLEKRKFLLDKATGILHHVNFKDFYPMDEDEDKAEEVSV